MKQYEIESSKSSETTYTVTIDGPDGNTCTCKAFEFSTANPPHCKHIDTGIQKLQDEFNDLMDGVGDDGNG